MSCPIPRSLIGYGALLQYSEDCETFITVGGTADIDVPNIVREKTESNDDDGDRTIHYVPNPQIEVEDGSFEIDFFPQEHTRLYRIKMENVPRIMCWRIVLNTPTQWYFRWCGYIGQLSVAVPKKDLVRATLQVNYTGGLPEVGFLVS